MNKGELTLTLSLKALKSEEKTKKAVDLILKTITDKLQENGRVEIRDFGAFTVKFYASIKHNPKTKEKFFKETVSVKFRAGKELKERVNSKNERNRLG